MQYLERSFFTMRQDDFVTRLAAALYRDQLWPDWFSENAPGTVLDGKKLLIVPASGGQVLQYQIRVPFRARRVVPAHFARQYAAFGQVAGVEFAQRRDRAFDPGHGRRVEGHGDEPPLAPPFDFSLGETRRAHQARHAVGFRNGAGVGKHRQRQVGRQQRTGEVLDGRCHGYSVLTLMEPMLSMATSWAAEAL